MDLPLRVLQCAPFSLKNPNMKKHKSRNKSDVLLFRDLLFKSLRGTFAMDESDFLPVNGDIFCKHHKACL